MRAALPVIRHRGYKQRTEAGEVYVNANSQTILTDELPDGEHRYNVRENRFYVGALTAHILKHPEATPV